jgi:hypothetical protein
MITSKDLEIVAELAGEALMTESDAEENDCVDGRNECFDAIERVWAEVHRLERLTNTAGDNEHNFELAYEHRVRDYNMPQDGWDSLNDIAIINDIAIEEANKAMNKTNRIADWIYAGREVALIVGGVVMIGTVFYLAFSVF